jgi:hypothetical protein
MAEFEAVRNHKIPSEAARMLDFLVSSVCIHRLTEQQKIIFGQAQPASERQEADEMLFATLFALRVL